MTIDEILDILKSTFQTTGVYNFRWNLVIMWCIACLFIYLAIAKKFEPLLLLMHAMGPNLAGVIGTAAAAGMFIAMFD
jgi:Na+-transporting methylmalonyl-CoA/oxaloacetate decarboxylase beta subunit